MKVQTHFIITGRVQGVFYRASAVDEATRLGLSGWARNRRSGDVELVAYGDAALIDQLESWLWHGPRMAMVTGLVRQEQVPEEWEEGAFRIRGTL
ncbi:MAG TPA: acylphosphatase [Gammaproteobacteria bacterium]|nr:acylphosphatase [Gammaproteobacteria bacterium]